MIFTTNCFGPASINFENLVTHTFPTNGKLGFPKAEICKMLFLKMNWDLSCICYGILHKNEMNSKTNCGNLERSKNVDNTFESVPKP